jgi:hypothetical protein
MPTSQSGNVKNSCGASRGVGVHPGKLYDGADETDSAGLILLKGVLNESFEGTSNRKTNTFLPWSTYALGFYNGSLTLKIASEGKSDGFQLHSTAQGADRAFLMNQWVHVLIHCSPHLQLISMFLNGKLNAQAQMPFDLFITGCNKRIVQKEIVIESDHPYAQNSNLLFPLSVKNAVGYTLKFDSKSSTKASTDRIKVYKPRNAGKEGISQGSMYPPLDIASFQNGEVPSIAPHEATRSELAGLVEYPGKLRSYIF